MLAVVKIHSATAGEHDDELVIPPMSMIAASLARRHAIDGEYAAHTKGYVMIDFREHQSSAFVNDFGQVNTRAGWRSVHRYHEEDEKRPAILLARSEGRLNKSENGYS
jgi:hypothetical protein